MKPISLNNPKRANAETRPAGSAHHAGSGPALGLSSPKGVLVVEVQPGSPADLVGIDRQM